MTPIQAPGRVSVPRPLTVQTSYSARGSASSADPSEPAGIADTSGPDHWPDRGRLGAALVRAAAGLTRRVSHGLLEEELGVLVNAGRRLLDEAPDPARPLSARVRLDSAPREG